MVKFLSDLISVTPGELRSEFCNACFLRGNYASAYDVVCPFFDDASEGPIPSMYLVMRYLNKFSSVEEGTPRFTALDFSGDNVIIAGQVLYLRDIRYFVETIHQRICENLTLMAYICNTLSGHIILGEIATEEYMALYFCSKFPDVIDEVKEIFRVHLFFGLDIFDVNWSPGVVHEEPRNRSIGYSCFQEPSNSFRGHRLDLAQAILTHPSLLGRFHFVSREGKIIWKAGPCFAYMATYHEVEMLLFCGTQTSVGEPARGSEIASHLVSNVAGGIIRNLLIMFQYPCMMGTFNKTSHLTEHDLAMMRVPHPEVGQLLIMCLTFIRPIIVVWQTYFSGQKAAARAKNNLFFGPYRPVTSPELSRNLARHTQRLLNIRITMGLWRHVATWFLNYHSVRFREHHILSNRTSLAVQSGHSEGTHALYAADVRLSAGIDFHAFFDTMRTSGVWHDLVGFSHFSQPALLEAMMAMPRQMESILATTSPATDSIPVGPSTVDITEEVKKMILPDILQAISQSRANDCTYLLESTGVNLSSPPSQALRQPVTHSMHPSRLRDLRLFLNNDSASFKDPQQALALELIRAKEPSLFVIGPTGV